MLYSCCFLLVSFSHDRFDFSTLASTFWTLLISESLLLPDLLDLRPLGLLPRRPESSDSDQRSLERRSLERRSLERRPLLRPSQDRLDLDLDLRGVLLAEDPDLGLSGVLDLALKAGALDLDLLGGVLDPDLLAGDLAEGLTSSPLAFMALTLA